MEEEISTFKRILWLIQDIVRTDIDDYNERQIINSLIYAIEEMYKGNHNKTKDNIEYVQYKLKTLKHRENK